LTLVPSVLEPQRQPNRPTPIVAVLATVVAAASGASVTSELLTDGLMFCTVAVTTPFASVESPCTYFDATPLSQPQAFAAGGVTPDW
jgi:hypothetical protein